MQTFDCPTEAKSNDCDQRNEQSRKRNQEKYARFERFWNTGCFRNYKKQQGKNQGWDQQWLEQYRKK
ncbi:hypothetical protein GCM10009119_18540 [Algoriphagus jejuensis]|uniref:Uncharacterized protein n=1 Tax=Algoriphagus jejuensis TaxID=419934 RepID=A0ABP3YE37_9BACT